MQLRPYQDDTIFHLINSTLERECICLPTGAGKTFIFSTFAGLQALENRVTVILVNRIELLNQTVKSVYSTYGIMPSVINAKSKSLGVNKIYVAMIETIARRKPHLEFLRSICDTLIVDECHIGSFNKVLDGFRRVVGFSATPMYVKKGTCLADFYKNLFIPVQVPELIEANYLSPAEMYAPKEAIDRSQFGLNKAGTDYDENMMGKTLSSPKYVEVLLAYVRRFCTGKRAIIYNASIEHSVIITSVLRQAGMNAWHVDGTTPEGERKAILGRLFAEPDCIVSNVNILTFGFDCPEVEVILLNRLTKSLSLFLQMCGRGSRLSSIINKDKFTIIDLCNNYSVHGLWQEEKEWDMLFAKSGSEKEGVAPVKICPKCENILPASVMVCPSCGHVFEHKQPGEVAEIDPELVKIENIKKNLVSIMDRVKQNGNNVYRGLHLMKEKIYQENSKLPLPELQALLLQALPEWCKESGKKNSQWNRDFCNNIMKEFYESKHLPPHQGS
jgi:superfamily II DNA or RNA helicase/rubredoxin